MIVTLIAWTIVIAIEAFAVYRGLQGSTWTTLVAIGFPLLVWIAFVRAWRRHKIDPEALVAAAEEARMARGEAAVQQLIEDKASMEAKGDAFLALIGEVSARVGGPVMGSDGAGKAFAHPELLKALDRPENAWLRDTADRVIRRMRFQAATKTDPNPAP